MNLSSLFPGTDLAGALVKGPRQSKGMTAEDLNPDTGVMVSTIKQLRTLIGLIMLQDVIQKPSQDKTDLYKTLLGMLKKS